MRSFYLLFLLACDEPAPSTGGDADGDGYTVADGDCWDAPADGWDPLNGFPELAPADVHPGAVEAWYDGLDQDCADGDDFDQDGDTFTTDAYPDATGALGLDCVDTDAGAYPGAEEIWYDGVDQDCVGDADDDQDGDGANADADCDDVDPDVNPGAVEDCATAVDDNCSGGANDEDALSCRVLYADADADRHGLASDAACICEPDDAHPVEDSSDCDDTDIQVNPDQAETCSTDVDDDCDGATNEFDADGCVPWFFDGDADGHGTAFDSTCACAAEGVYSATLSDDCNDTDATIYPGAEEICNGFDEDCDEVADEGLAECAP